MLCLVVNPAVYLKNPTKPVATATLRKGSESRAVTVSPAGAGRPPLAPLANETNRAEFLLSGGALPLYSKPIAQDLAPTATGFSAPKAGSPDNPHRVSIKLNPATGNCHRFRDHLRCGRQTRPRRVFPRQARPKPAWRRPRLGRRLLPPARRLRPHALRSAPDLRTGNRKRLRHAIKPGARFVVLAPALRRIRGQARGFTLVSTCPPPAPLMRSSPLAAMPASRRRPKKSSAAQLPPATDWRTTDEHELLKRRLRAKEEKPRVENLDPAHPVFSNFAVNSPSGLGYQVEIRDLAARRFACTCTDFRINGLGTCKHIEAVLLHLGRREKDALRVALVSGSTRIDLVPDSAADTLRVERNLDELPARLRALFSPDGALLPDADPETAVARFREHSASPGTPTSPSASPAPALRVSQEVAPWLEARRRARERVLLRRDYETGVADGRHAEHVTKYPLFPYQREGMLHLAFKERALLADEMGLGKTIQAIAACALLHRLGRAARVLVVTPASLKTEWEEQIRRFTDHGLRLVFGNRAARLRAYAEPEPPFFTIANYEQIVADALDINERLRPDIVVLDEAQRIKNWSTKTAQAVKRLRSRHAFVLTGTPIENRIDELRSIVDYLDPSLLGPLFRFNRDYYTFDDKGRPDGYKNLGQLRARVAPILLRRRKHHVETELPDRTDRNLFVALTPEQRVIYAGYEEQVAKLVHIAKRRPLTPKEQDKLMVFMAMMRMVCDTPAIIKDQDCDDCPKLDELVRVLDEVLSDPDVKVIVFSEWEGMLQRVRAHAESAGIGYAWHTGSVPQQRRRAEILAFRQDPACRLFLSTDSGGVGLNLQNASVVINCDLPWNPARLEQRIARAWRKNQLRPVTVINLVAENTLEHGMLASLANKQELAHGVLDGEGDLSTVTLKRGRQDLLKRLEQTLAKSPSPAPGTPSPSSASALPPQPAADPAAAFAATVRQRLAARLVRCDEIWLPSDTVAERRSRFDPTSAAPAPEASTLLCVVQSDAASARPVLEALLADTPWRGERPPLQIIDESAWAAIEQLRAAGLLTLDARATRDLLSSDPAAAPAPPGPPPLTPEQQARLSALRDLARRKAKAARALLAADLPDEALEPLQAAALALAQAEAVESRADEPSAPPTPVTLADASALLETILAS